MAAVCRIRCSGNPVSSSCPRVLVTEQSCLGTGEILLQAHTACVFQEALCPHSYIMRLPPPSCHSVFTWARPMPASAEDQTVTGMAFVPQAIPSYVVYFHHLYHVTGLIAHRTWGHRPQAGDLLPPQPCQRPGQPRRPYSLLWSLSPSWWLLPTPHPRGGSWYLSLGGHTQHGIYFSSAGHHCAPEEQPAWHTSRMPPFLRRASRGQSWNT